MVVVASASGTMTYAGSPHERPSAHPSTPQTSLMASHVGQLKLQTIVFLGWERKIRLL